jgi:hypothetical protein
MPEHALRLFALDRGGVRPANLADFEAAHGDPWPRIAAKASTLI